MPVRYDVDPRMAAAQDFAGFMGESLTGDPRHRGGLLDVLQALPLGVGAVKVARFGVSPPRRAVLEGAVEALRERVPKFMRYVESRLPSIRISGARKLGEEEAKIETGVRPVALRISKEVLTPGNEEPVAGLMLHELAHLPAEKVARIAVRDPGRALKLAGRIESRLPAEEVARLGVYPEEYARKPADLLGELLASWMERRMMRQAGLRQFPYEEIPKVNLWKSP